MEAFNLCTPMKIFGYLKHNIQCVSSQKDIPMLFDPLGIRSQQRGSLHITDRDFTRRFARRLKFSRFFALNDTERQPCDALSWGHMVDDLKSYKGVPGPAIRVVFVDGIPKIDFIEYAEEEKFLYFLRCNFESKPEG